MRRARILLATLAMLIPAVPVLGATASVAHAASCTGQPGGPYPNDPQYAPAENGQPGATWDQEDWYLYGCVPNGTAPLSSDPQGASGMSVSDLWNRAINPQRGQDNVTVAYVEGGVNWRIPTSCELKDRAALNTGELPYPEDANGHTKPYLAAQGQLFANANPYDLNNDGVVNVEDYVNDPRVLAADVGQTKSPAGGPFLHHVCSAVGPGHSDITPEDLIVAFGHCQVASGAIGPQGCPAGGRFDNDGNGYPNDINGWDFNRDNNDPQTEQSIYAHFDDESAQAIGEGNNANASIGLCPLCRYVPIKAGDEAIDRPDRVAEAIVYAADIGINVLDVTSASLGLNQTVQDAINYAYNKGTVVVMASNDFESADHTDGMYYAHVWPGNSITGDHSTRNNSGCPAPPADPGSALCAFVLSNTTFNSRSSLTSYGPHALFSVPNNDGSTSTGTPTQAGVAALVVSEGMSAVGARPDQLAAHRQRGGAGGALDGDAHQRALPGGRAVLHGPERLDVQHPVRLRAPQRARRGRGGRRRPHPAGRRHPVAVVVPVGRPHQAAEPARHRRRRRAARQPGAATRGSCSTGSARSPTTAPAGRRSPAAAATRPRRCRGPSTWPRSRRRSGEASTASTPPRG